MYVCLCVCARYIFSSQPLWKLPAEKWFFIECTCLGWIIGVYKCLPHTLRFIEISKKKLFYFFVLHKKNNQPLYRYQMEVEKNEVKKAHTIQHSYGRHAICFNHFECSVWSDRLNCVVRMHRSVLYFSHMPI